jgi:hypothetical protein
MILLVDLLPLFNLYPRNIATSRPTAVVVSSVKDCIIIMCMKLINIATCVWPIV